MGARGRRISSGEANQECELLGGAGHEPVTLESAHDSNGRLRCAPDHVSHDLPGHLNRQTDSVRILDSIALMAFSRFLKHTSAHRSRQNGQERNTVQLMRKGGAGGLIL